MRDTLACLEMGAVETLVVWENLEIVRMVLNNPSTSVQDVKYITKEQETDDAHYKDKASGLDLDIVDKQPLLEWLANEYKKFGCALEFVTNKSQEGSQFCRGFGGIGGILRYQVNTAEFDDEYGEDDGFDDDDDDNGSTWSSDPDF